jgi:hypothetical protein
MSSYEFSGRTRSEFARICRDLFTDRPEREKTPIVSLLYLFSEWTSKKVSGYEYQMRGLERASGTRRYVLLRPADNFTTMT